MTALRSPRAVASGLALLALTLAGCSGVPVAFSADQSVHITDPGPLAVVALPFRATWTAPGRTHDRFAVFLDRAPIAPGGHLRDLAGSSCKGQAHCPDATFLAGLGVYVTSSHAVTIPTLPVLGGTNGREPHPVHTLTIVVINGAGRRLGAASWQTEFRA